MARRSSPRGREDPLARGDREPEEPPVVIGAGDGAGGGGGGEEMPRVRLTRRRVALGALFVGACLAFLYFVLPKIVGLRDTWSRIEHGNGWWLGLGAVLEICSFLGYVVLFRGVFVSGRSRIDLRVSYQVTMAGLAATRLFASGGAGGVALTAWALRRSGMDPRTVARRMIAFMTCIYVVFLGALVIGGFGLAAGVLPGAAPFALTAVPAIVAALLILLALLIAFVVPGDLDRRLRAPAGSGRRARVTRRLAQAPAALGGGIRLGLGLLRWGRPEIVGGALAWWGFDIAVLWAAFHAFGGHPELPVLVVCYFIGQLGALLPLPGGIGGVEGALIGSLSAFGVPGSLAVVSVLAYRAFSFWLPTVPGVLAYFGLRRTVRGWGAADPGPA